MTNQVLNTHDLEAQDGNFSSLFGKWTAHL